MIGRRSDHPQKISQPSFWSMWTKHRPAPPRGSGAIPTVAPLAGSDLRRLWGPRQVPPPWMYPANRNATNATISTRYLVSSDIDGSRNAKDPFIRENFQRGQAQQSAA